MEEIWKPVSKKMYFFSNFVNQDYEVSNLGNIRNAKTGRKINPFLTQNGKKLRWNMHKSFGEGNMPSSLQFLVDQTVYITFSGSNKSYGRPIKHKDGNLMNNAYDNLYL